MKNKFLNPDVPPSFAPYLINSHCMLYANSNNDRIKIYFSVSANKVVEKQFIKGGRRLDGYSFCHYHFQDETYLAFSILNNGVFSKRIVIGKIE